eukprot:6535923-Ditylum_brightwellii.AAC.1
MLKYQDVKELVRMKKELPASPTVHPFPLLTNLAGASICINEARNLRSSSNFFFNAACSFHSPNNFWLLNILRAKDITSSRTPNYQQS